MIIRKYSEMILLPTLEERFDYLKLSGSVGVDTFGFDRYLNQKFYNSKEWKSVRNKVIVRDEGYDLGIFGMEIPGRVIIHHMNPIGIQDISLSTEYLLDPNYLICVSHDTHNAIHYSDKKLLPKPPSARRKYDTCPWKKGV